MGYTYNPDGYDEKRGFSVPAIGPHEVQIVDVTEKKSNSNNPMMEIVAEIISGESKGSKLWEYIVYNEYADSKFGQILHACGKDPSVKREMSANLFMGLTATIQIKHETYQGEKRAKIHYWIASEETTAPENENQEPPAPVEDDVPF